MKGTIKFFDQAKGFGFVVGEDGIERFVGVRDINGAELPNNGDNVEFEHQDAKKGPKAVNLKILKKAPQQMNQRQDDRIECPSCKKKIVPRLVTYRGEPDKSLCPFCGATVKSFGCFGIILMFIIPASLLSYIVSLCA